MSEKASAKELYNILMSSKNQSLNSKYETEIPCDNGKTLVVHDKDFNAVISVIGKIAKSSVDFEDFYSKMQSKDLPPIKLTDREMELLRGGGVIGGLLTDTFASILSKTGAGKAIFNSGLKQGIEQGFGMGVRESDFVAREVLEVRPGFRSPLFEPLEALFDTAGKRAEGYVARWGKSFSFK